MRVEVWTSTGNVVREVSTFHVASGVLCLYVANPEAARAGHTRYQPPSLPDTFYAPGQWSRITRLDGRPQESDDGDTALSDVTSDGR